MTNMNPLKLSTNITLSNLHETLFELEQFLGKVEQTQQTGFLEFDFAWIDLAALAQIAIVLRNWGSSHVRGPEVTVHFRKKKDFFVKSGFVEAIRLNKVESPFANSTLNFESTKIQQPINMTPIFLVPLEQKGLNRQGFSETSSRLCREHFEAIDSLAVYAEVANAALFKTRDYLSIVFWELVENAIDHSRSHFFAFASQVFISEPQDKYDLSQQYRQECDYCVDGARKNWLKKHCDRPFLQLVCADHGRGIINSLKFNAQLNDGDLMEAFQQYNSTRYNDLDRGRSIHGLHLIADLVERTDGYLYVGSNHKSLELTREYKNETLANQDLAGTLYQILLPLDNKANYATTYVSPSRKVGTSVQEDDAVRAIEISRRVTFDLPPLGDDIVKVANQTASEVRSKKAKYLDFVGMPRERHFASRLIEAIRFVRKERFIVVINVPDDLFAAVDDVCTTKRAPSHTELDNDLVVLDERLSSEWTRGDPSLLMPMVIPITKLELDKNSVSIRWLGLGGLSSEGAISTIQILNELFTRDEQLSAAELAYSLKCDPDSIDEQLHRLATSNPGLFYHSDSRWKLSFNASSIYFDSIISLEQQLVRAIVPVKASSNTIFFLPWRDESSAYISSYYSLWNVLADEQLARSAALLLLAKATSNCPELPRVVAVFSVTASAGLLAREIARVLRIPHWETWSIFDIEAAEWPDNFDGSRVLIVDDLIDTGTTTQCLIRNLKNRQAHVIATLALVETINGQQERSKLSIPVLSVSQVTLDRVTKAPSHTVLEIDPNTLQPHHESRHRTPHRSDESSGAAIYKLIEWGALRTGHFVYNAHHYDMFFDIVQLLKIPEAYIELENWFWKSVGDWYNVRKKDGAETVSIIYPYFSPIAAFLHELNPKTNSRRPCDLTIHVAQPFKRSQGRIGYYLTQPDQLADLAVFIDDGVASGGTLAAIIDEYLYANSNNPKRSKTGSFLALAIFDRIGMSARKHLRNIATYRAESAQNARQVDVKVGVASHAQRPIVEFTYSAKYSVSLRSFFPDSCPICNLVADLNRLRKVHQKRVTLEFSLNSFLESVIDTLLPTFVSTVATQAIRPELSLFSNEDIKFIANARSVLYSDQATGNGIRKSLIAKDKTFKARLELFLTVSSDGLLWNKVRPNLSDANVSISGAKEHTTATSDFLTDIPDLFTDESVDNRFRLWFLLNLPYAYDPNVARNVLCDGIPCAIEQRTFGGANKQIEFSDYLDANPTFLPCVVYSLRLLADRLQRDDFESDLLILAEKWTFLFQRRAPTYQYLFRSGILDRQAEYAIGQAEMLVVNFVSQYAIDHDESLLNQYKKTLPGLGTRSATFVRSQVSLFVFSAIRNVSRFFGLQECFPETSIMHLESLQRRYDELVENAGSDEALSLCGQEYRDALLRCFPPSNADEPPMLLKLLSHCAPVVGEVLSFVHSSLNEKLKGHGWIVNSKEDEGLSELAKLFATKEDLRCEFSFSTNSLRPRRVFASSAFLEIAVEHLLRNPIEQYESDSAAWNGQPLLVNLALETTGSFLEFRVESNQSFTQSDVELMLKQWGGLQAQRTEISNWDGSLKGQAGEKSVAFILQVRTIRTEVKK